MGRPTKLAPQVAEYKERAMAETGKVGEVVTFGNAPASVSEAEDMLGEYAEAGIDRVILGRNYETPADWQPAFEVIEQLQR